MSEYITSQQGNVLIIILPLALIISKTLMFLKGYLKNNSKIVTSVNHASVIFTIISTILFYMHDWGKYFCAIWFFSITIYLIIFNFMYRKIEGLYNPTPNIFEIATNCLSILLGIFIVSIPDTEIINLIGLGGNTNIEILFKILIYIYGTLLILLDNHIILFYNKFIRQIDIKRF